MNERAHVFVEGRVQGVNFRGFARRAALELGLKGWVRNLYDGRVELLAEGDRAGLDQFVERLKAGPPFARVDQVRVRWDSATGEFTDFRVGWTDF